MFIWIKSYRRFEKLGNDVPSLSFVELELTGGGGGYIINEKKWEVWKVCICVFSL